MTNEEIIRKLNRLWHESVMMVAEEIEKLNADGCDGCAFESVEEWEMPCAKCKRNNKDYWRAKRDK